MQHCPLVVLIVYSFERRPYDVPGIAYNLWYGLIFDPHRHKEYCGPEGAWRNAAISSCRFLPLPNVILLYIAPAPVTTDSVNDSICCLSTLVRTAVQGHIV